MKSESAAGRSSGNDDALRAEEDVMTVQELIDKQIFGVVNLVTAWTGRLRFRFAATC